MAERGQADELMRGATATQSLVVLRVYDEVGQDGYPPEWHTTIKHDVRRQAGNRCIRCGHPYSDGEGEWSLCDERCDHDGPWAIDGVVYQTDDPLLTQRPQWPYTTRHRVYARWRILTVHHLNMNKADCRWWNLAALCQRCHLTIQRRVNLAQVYTGEHSDWFKPYAAGYYASVYLGEELTRAETVARLDKLLTIRPTADGTGQVIALVGVSVQPAVRRVHRCWFCRTMQFSGSSMEQMERWLLG